MKITIWRILSLTAYLSALLLANFGCSKTGQLQRPEQHGPINMHTIVAIAGNQYVDVAALFVAYNGLSTPGRNIPATPENSVREAIYKELVWQKIDDFNDYDHDEVDRLARNRLHQPLMDLMMDDLFGNQVVIADSSVDSFYQANLAHYTRNEERRATHLLVTTNVKAWQTDGIDVSGLSEAQLDRKAQARINDYYQQAKGGADLSELASKHTHDSGSKETKGDLGYFGRGKMVKEFEDVVFGMKKGQISKPFKTSFGYHIVRLDDIRPEEVLPLSDSLRAVIKAGLTGALRQRLALHFLDSLRTEAQYKWNEDLLQKGINDYDVRDWVCIVNGTDTVEANLLHQRELRYRTNRHISDVSVEDRKQLALAQIDPFLFSSAAKQLGYADSDSMKQIFDHFRDLEIVNRIYNERTRMDWQPSDEEMKDYYEAHRSDYQSDKPIKVKHIVFRDSIAALEALAEIKAGADFDSTALKYYPGDDDIKKAAYDLGWISREEMGPDFFNAAWVARPGDVVGPVHTDWGYHLIEVEEKKPLLDFEGAKLEIGKILRAQKREEIEQKWVDWLTRGKKVEVFDDILSQIDFTNQGSYQQVTDSLQQAGAAVDSVS